MDGESTDHNIDHQNICYVPHVTLNGMIFYLLSADNWKWSNSLLVGPGIQCAVESSDYLLFSL